MTVKLGDHFSKTRTVNVGAPQGTVLGTYVFNVATDDLEDEFNETASGDEFELEEGDLTFLETFPNESGDTSTPVRNTTLADPPVSPIVGNQEIDYVLLPTTRNVPPELTSRIEPTWGPKPITVRKFIDDLQIQKLNMKKQKTYRQGCTVFKNPRIITSEKMFKHIA